VRLFFAVVPPRAVREEIHRVVAATTALPGQRWTRPSNLHLTLLFLGDVDPSGLPAARAALDGLLGHGAFPVRVGRLGAFPHRGRARVLILSTLAGTAPLTALHDALAASFPDAAGPRRYTPHLTLARARSAPDPAALDGLAAELEPHTWEFRAESVELVHSELRHDGAHYRTLHRVGL